MVYGATLKERVQQLVDLHGEKQVADWAKMSISALEKWLAGGGATDEKLRNLAEGSGEGYFDLKYGHEWREAASRELGEDFPVEPVSRADAIDVLDTLPPRFRELWVTLGRLMIQRYAPQGPKNPTGGTGLGGVPAGAGRGRR